MTLARLHAVTLALCALSWGCGSSTQPASDARGDGATTDGTQTDAAGDVGDDAALDGQGDAGSDLGGDAAGDAKADASDGATDTGTDAAVDTGTDGGAPSGPSGDRIVYAVTAANELVTFAASQPGVLLSTATITGLNSGETLLGIDFRPASGGLYALGSTSRIYTINTSTGAATAVGTGPFAPAISGTSVGFDFNPAVDRIRLVTDQQQNLRLHPGTGAVAATDTNLSGTGTPGVVAAAYSNNHHGGTTTLYGIDATANTLVLQGGVAGNPSPNGGAITTVGALGVDVAIDAASFDITPDGVGFAAMALTGASPQLYAINLTTGAASSLGLIGVISPIRGIAVATDAPPVVYAVTSANNLVRFSSAAPGTIQSSVAISGLQGGESILGIDFRPRTGELFALGSTSRIYTINTTTGAATQAGSGVFTPGLTGTAVGFDFNPLVDRVRFVSDTQQNQRFEPDTGANTTDSTLTLSGGTPQLIGLAYSSNHVGGTTTLFGIDSQIDALVQQGGVAGSPSPNGGVLTKIGDLGVDVGTGGGFDITPQGTGLAVLTPASGTNAGSPVLYAINLTTGAASSIGVVNTGAAVVAMAVPTATPRTMVAVTASNKLLRFSSATPGTVISTVAITGLQSGETIRGIDVRPATGELYALGDSRLYRINATSGAATQVGSGQFTPALTGTSTGFDFNPSVDRIRVVTNANQNLRLHPTTGVVAATDTALSGPADAAAYSVNFVGGTTTLFVLNSAGSTLLRQGGVGGNPSPNGGVLTNIGAFNAPATIVSGSFDITPDGVGLAALSPQAATASSLVAINLVTGGANLIGDIAGGELVVGVTTLY